MASAYDPSTEMDWDAWWYQHLVAPGAAKRTNGQINESKDTFSMLLPPPNVTGALHIGHALTVALQDALARWQRARGKRVVWVPGLDHAGIATQAVVEKELLRTQGLTRHDLGREEFVRRVHEWTREYGGRIRQYIRRMGASLDWRREFFTLDEQRSKAVRRAFVRMARSGLLYRSTRKVHWCPHLRTALSDAEVEPTRVKNQIVHLPVPGGSGADAAHGSSNGTRPVRLGLLYSIGYPLAPDALALVKGHEGSALAECHASMQDWGTTSAHEEGTSKGSDESEAETEAQSEAGSAVTPSAPVLLVETTRPETLLGDVAVAVHPEDGRLGPMAAGGCHVVQPMSLPGTEEGVQAAMQALQEGFASGGAEGMKRAADAVGIQLVPIVGDPVLVDPELGTGAVKVTPHHDPSDRECADRLGIPLGSPVYGPDGVVRGLFQGSAAGAQLAGQDRLDARQGVVRVLQGYGLYRGEQPWEMSVPLCSRSGDLIEPMWMPQWHVRCGPLEQAQRQRGAGEGGTQESERPSATGLMPLARDMVNSGAIDMVPEDGAKEWNRWLGANQDWCISRQLWWGHRIPAWVVCNGTRAVPMSFRNGSYESGSDGIGLDLDDAARYAWARRGVMLQAAGETSEGIDATWHAWVVAEDAEEARSLWVAFCEEARIISSAGAGSAVLKQDEDVLDTWFSSGLLPLSALGWPWAPGEAAAVGESLHADSYLPGVSESEHEQRVRSIGAEWGEPESSSERGLDYPLAELPPSHRDMYPLSTMETGADILFFWVARMAMMCASAGPDGLGRAGDGGSAASMLRPFNQVLLHGMVRDGEGRKMSKSKGNVIDPMHVIYGRPLEAMVEDIEQNHVLPAREKKRAIKATRRDFKDGLPQAGADALRFAMCYHASYAAGINMDVRRVHEFRLFCNKAWQSVRFSLQHIEAETAAVGAAMGESKGRVGCLPGGLGLPSLPLPEAGPQALPLPSRWVLSRLAACCEDVETGLETFNMSRSTKALHRWWQQDFCDVYLEWSKPALWAGGQDSLPHRGTLAVCVDAAARLLQPFMPHLAEEFYQRLHRTGLDGDGDTVKGADSKLDRSHCPAPSVGLAPFPTLSGTSGCHAYDAEAAPSYGIVERPISEFKSSDTESSFGFLLDVVAAARGMAAVRSRILGAGRTEPSARQFVFMAGSQELVDMLEEHRSELEYLLRLRGGNENGGAGPKLLEVQLAAGGEDGSMDRPAGHIGRLVEGAQGAPGGSLALLVAASLPSSSDMGNEGASSARGLQAESYRLSKSSSKLLKQIEQIRKRQQRAQYRDKTPLHVQEKDAQAAEALAEQAREQQAQAEELLVVAREVEGDSLR